MNTPQSIGERLAQLAEQEQAVLNDRTMGRTEREIKLNGIRGEQQSLMHIKNAQEAQRRAHISPIEQQKRMRR